MDGEGSEMHEIVQDHERRILDLEKNHTEMKNGMLRIENTVLQEGQNQKQILNSINEKLLEHFFGERKEIRTNKVKMSEIRWTTVAGILGAGGGVALVVQWVVTQLGGM